MKQNNTSKETNCIHSKFRDKDASGSINTPIHASSSYDYRTPAETVYPRYYNTINQKEIVQKLCALEEGEDGLLFASGMAAISGTLFALLKAGDHVVFASQLYGGTFNLIKSEFPKFDLGFSFVSGNNARDFETAIQPNTRIIYIETPSNPLLDIIDIQVVAAVAKRHNLLTVIDNTFASPVNQNPLALGMDVVIHSGTKYLGGHSDLCFGAVITSAEIAEVLYKSAINFGGSINAMDSYLIERSLKTLAVRVQRQNENAGLLAEFLSAHDMIGKVYYPGLKAHPEHEIASRQMRGFGGMLAFELKITDGQAVDCFLNGLSLIQPAISLGGVETIICSPARTSHIKMSREQRMEMGVTDSLLRLSTGIEKAEDLTGDLNFALNLVKQQAGNNIPA